MSKILHTLVFLSALIAFSFDIHAQTIRYVRPSATGSGDGSSWTNAAGNLQDMINASSAGDEVWVAAGTYTPATSTGHTMKEAVKIYGGFPATGNPTFADRNWQTHISLLQGYAPLLNVTQRVINNTGTGLTTAALLDGFTVANGKTRNLFEHGAGMYNNGASPTVQNCIFTNNLAQGEGGGVYNVGCSPVFINCTFSGNEAQYLYQVDPPGSGGGMGNYNSHPTVTDCTFTGNSSGRHGGALSNISSNPTLTNCTFTNNSGYGGGAVYNDAASPLFTKCVFSGNDGATGGAVYNYNSPDPRFTGCTFAGNHAGIGGAVYNEKGYYIQVYTNCVFYQNWSDNSYGGAVCNSSAVSKFYNCVFTGNTSASNPAIIFAMDYTNSQVYNSVIYGNSGALARYNFPNEPVTMNNSLVQGLSFSPGNPGNNIDGATDPLFTDAANAIGADGIWGTADDGLQLQPCSPLIGTGNNALVNVPTDILGNARIQNGKVDIGAYESNYITASGPSLFVDGGVAASGTGTGWGSPFKTLVEALAAANQCSSVASIFVAKGTYYPTGAQNGTDRNATFLIPQRGGIKIYGGYPTGGGTRNITANPTILSGDIGTPVNKTDNSYHVMVMTGTLAGADSVVIDGFTITGGNANSGTQHTYNGQLTNQSEGGGLLLRENSNIGNKITVRNCTITANAATDAAGLYMWASSALVHHTVISENTASGSGGGVFIYETSSPKIINSVISKNTATNGGGIYNLQASTSLSIINTTISDNTATTNGNNIHNHTGATVNMANSIVWGPDAAKNIHNTSTFNATYSDILQPGGAYAGTGNINAVPLFRNPVAGDYLPSPCSPVINAGNNTAVNNAPSGSGTSDILGNPRIFGSVVDIGAYELQIAAGAPPFTITTSPPQSICFGSGFPELRLKGENGQVCFIINENATQTITAPAGTVFSEVVFASYGNASGSCETGFTKGTCHAANSATVVGNLALGQNSFTITANNGTFGGDPCSGITKKLYIKLSYVYTTTYTWTNNNPAIGLAASGTGDIPAFTATNAGTATITVTAINNGCTVSPVTFTYTVNPTPSATTAQTNVGCYGGNNGIASITAISNGTAPYTYSWTNSSSDSTKAVNLVAGVYTCTITDANGCFVVKTFTITQPDPLTANTSQTHVKCNGDHTGGVAITAVSGGTAPYTYLWNTGATASSIENLTAGTYTCTITDAHNCTIVRPVTITQPVPLIASTAQTNISCFGGNNGEASVNAGGGVSPYTYLWNTGAITASITNLTIGDYSCTIKDANGCIIIRNITITQPDLLTATIDKTDVNCYDEASATASVAASGGTLPYTYLWNTAAATASITNLTAGNYSCTITDNKGCEVVRNITITNPVNPFLVTAIAADNHVSCYGGSNGKATVSATGGTGSYTYQWSGGATSVTASDLAAGTHTCTITDGGGCETTRAVTITQPAELEAIIFKIDADCDGGSASVTVSGGTAPYTYLWSNGSDSTKAVNLTTGDYTCTITDANDCLLTKEFTITDVQLIIPVASQSVCIGNNTTAVSFASPEIAGGTEMCFIINEGQAQTITAPVGQVFTSVLFASYGNASGDCTNGFTIGSCHAASSRSIIESRALGNNSFTVAANNATFGDPCPGTAKKLYITIAYTDPGASSSAYSYSWTNDNPSIGLPASGTGGLIPSFTTLAAGVANITLTASLAGCNISETATFTYTVVDKESLYVDGTVSASGDGKSWGTAFKTLQEALAATGNPSQCGAGSILVAAGVYTPPVGQGFSMVESVKILGGYPNGGGDRDINHNRTILEANDYSYIIYNENNGLTAAALLDGFTLSGTDHSYYPAVYNYAVFPTISHCVFTNNRGGAIYNYAAYGSEAMEISHCVFSDNGNTEYATTGGIENWESRVLIANCLFSGNTAHVGGAVVNYYTEGTVVNCTFYNNSSVNNGYPSHAMYNESSSLSMANNIFAGHSGRSVLDQYGATDIAYSLIEDEAYVYYSGAGNANIQADPQFVNVSDPVGADGIWGTADDGLRLQASSPAVNGGSGSHYTNKVGIPVETDLDISGNPRLYGENVDMGAYEYQGAPLPVTLISFTVQKLEHTAVLNWTTATEQNSRGFEIEHSTDAKSWSKIGYQLSLAENGNSTHILSYAYKHLTPAKGNNYYRLKQLDISGRYEYSPVRTVNFEESTISIYPNPARDFVHITGLKGDETISVSDLHGNTIKQIKSTGKQKGLSLESLHTGVYQVHIIPPGGSPVTFKLVKAE